MTTEQTALHERFLKGITLKMLGYGAFGLITVVSSFWVGYNNMQANIKENNNRCDSRMTAIMYAFKKSQDSTQNLNERQFEAIWNAIKKPEVKIIYRDVISHQGFATEHKATPNSIPTFLNK